MTIQEKNLLVVGSCFETPFGLQYKVIGINNHKDDLVTFSYLTLENLRTKENHTIHYSKQPFEKLLKLSEITLSKKGSPYGTSRNLF